MKRPPEPSSRRGWWAFWLGFAAGFWGPILLALPGLSGLQLPGRLRLDAAGVALEVALIIAALVVGVLAFRKGERSWCDLVRYGRWLKRMASELRSDHESIFYMSRPASS